MCVYASQGILGGGFKHFIISPRSLEFHDPIWLAHIFQMGGSTTDHFMFAITRRWSSIKCRTFLSIKCRLQVYTIFKPCVSPICKVHAYIFCICFFLLFFMFHNYSWCFLPQNGAKKSLAQKSLHKEGPWKSARHHFFENRKLPFWMMICTLTSKTGWDL